LADLLDRKEVRASCWDTIEGLAGKLGAVTGMEAHIPVLTVYQAKNRLVDHRSYSTSLSSPKRILPRNHFSLKKKHSDGRLSDPPVRFVRIQHENPQCFF